MSIYSKQQIKDLLDRVLDLAKECDQTELRFGVNSEALSRFANNNIQQNLSQESASLAITIVEKGCYGMANTTRLDETGLVNLVKQARLAASLQKPATEILPLVSSCDTPEKDCLDLETAEYDPEKKAEALKSTFRIARESGFESSGIFTNKWSQVAIANSEGLFCSYKTSSGTFSCTMHSHDSSGWAEKHSGKISEIDVEVLSKEACRIAVNGRNPQDLEPGEYTVVFPPAGVADLLMFLNWMTFGAQDYLEGISPVSGKLGEKLYGDKFSVVDDSDHPQTEGIPFDFEGSSRQKLNLIDNGVYNALAHDRVTAKLAGCDTTGHGFPRPNPHGPFPANLVMQGGDSSVEEMIASTKRGLLVTHLHYTNIQDPNKLVLTGMTRDGLFLIEDGKITGPVKNMRFTESLFNVFAGIESLTKDQELQEGFFGGGFVLPGMKIKSFNFTSSSSF
jgi:PmbA protein